MLIAVPLVITMAVGLVLGLRLVSERDASLKLTSRGGGAASAAPRTSANASASPSAPSATAGASTTPSAAATATPSTRAADMSCDIIVPANPLTGPGLAAPYLLTGPGGMSPDASGCTESNPKLDAFVQATILDPATGALSVYEPLVITQGTQAAVAPVVPPLPAGAVVTLDFGFSGTTLTLQGTTGTTLSGADCVKGIPGSSFGQVAFCDGTAFFAAVNNDIAAGLTAVPANGTSARTGQPCPTIRSFSVAGQNEGDDVTTRYLVNGQGQTAQDSAANVAALAGATVINNGSAVLTTFVDPVLGCSPFTAPDLSNAGAPGTSQALDELSAARNQLPPVALVPESDPMTLVKGVFSQRKTNRYRRNVDQPAIMKAQAADTPAGYCQDMVNVQSVFLKDNQTVLASARKPAPSAGSLFTLLANRLNKSFTSLGCQNLGLRNPVTVTVNGAGAVTAATVNATQQSATATTGAGAASPDAP
jgi:hypothetical protein